MSEHPAADPTNEPAEAPAPDPDRPVELPRGEVPTVHTADALTLSVLLSSVVMGLMLLVYVALVAAWGYLTLRFLMRVPALLDASGMFFSALVIFIAGAALLVLCFLVKPLIPMPRERPSQTELRRQDEPLLFEYVDAMADTIDAPRPDRVVVDVDANASASFGSGLLGALGGKLTLTLGLPIAGGLTIRQFAGIVAHELGHFSQGGMIRQNVMLSVISGWMTQVALGEDAFDRYLHRMASSGVFGVRLACRVAYRVTVSIRKLLFVMMYVGHAMSRVTARQLEYDADQFMAHTAGSKHFAETMRSTILLAHAGESTLEEVERFYRDRRLPTNLPSMVIARARRFTPEQRRKFLKGVERSETESFSTHPLTRKRIRAAEGLRSAGLVDDDRSARRLFQDFDDLCRRCSTSFYESVIREKFEPRHLVDSSLLIQELDETDQARLAAQRFCQGDALLALPTFPSVSALKRPEKPNDAMQSVNKLRQDTLRRGDDTVPQVRQLQETRERLMTARQALTVTQIGFQINHYGELGLTSGDRQGLEREVRALSEEESDLRAKLSSSTRVLTKRIELCAALLQIDKVAKRIKDEDPARVRREIKRLIPAGRALAKVEPSVNQLQVSGATLSLGLSLCLSGNVNQDVISRTKRASDDTRGAIADVLTVLHGKPYPFSHGDGRVSIAHALCQRPPDGDNPADILFVAEELVGRYNEVRVRIIGRLCFLAECIERAIGLKPLPALSDTDPLEELKEALGVHDEPEDAGTLGILGAAVPLFGHGVTGLAVLGIAGAGLYFAANYNPGFLSNLDLDASPSQRTAGSNSRADHTNGREQRNRLDPRSHRPDRPAGATDRTPSDTPGFDPANDPCTSVEDALARAMHQHATVRDRGIRYLLEQDPAAVGDRQPIVDLALEMALTEHHPPVRSQGYELLNRYAGDMGFAALAAAGPSAVSSARGDLAEYMSEFATPEAAAVLVGWIGTDLNHYAERALVTPNMSEHAEQALLERLAEETPRGRDAMMRVLEEIATEASVPFCESVMEDGNAVVRSSAERILREVSPTSIDAAARFLRLTDGRYTDSELRRALSALSQQDGRDDPRREAVCERLVEAMARASGNTDSMVWRALERWPGTAANELFAEVLNDERAPRDRVHTALEVVARQQTPDAAQRIIKWIILEPRLVQQALIDNGAASEQAVLEYIIHDNADVRLACCRVLQAVGTRASSRALNGRGNDRDERVRAAARTAFYAIRDRINAETGE